MQTRDRFDACDAKSLSYVQSFTFLIKQKAGKINVIAPSQQRTLLITMTNEVVDSEHLKDACEDDLDFRATYGSCKNRIHGKEVPACTILCRMDFYFVEATEHSSRYLESDNYTRSSCWRS